MGKNHGMIILKRECSHIYGGKNIAEISKIIRFRKEVEIYMIKSVLNLRSKLINIKRITPKIENIILDIIRY